MLQMIESHMWHKKSYDIPNTLYKGGAHALNNAGQDLTTSTHAVCIRGCPPASEAAFPGPFTKKSASLLSHNGMSVFIEKFDFQKLILLILRQC